MKKSVLVTTTAATLGLATVLTFAAVSPSMAKTAKHTTTAVSATAKTKVGNGSFDARVAPKTASLSFTVSNVPAAYASAAALGKQLVVRVVPLASTATSAPATPPVPAFGGPNFGSKDARGDNDGDGPAFNPGAAPTAPTTSGTATTAPSFGSGDVRGDNDGDGPGFGPGGNGGPAFGGHGHGGPRGGHGGPGFENFQSTLTLTGNTLTGTIQIPAERAAGVQNWAIYISVAADSTTGLAAQTGTPVFVVATTDASGNVTLSQASGPVAIDLSKNTGTAK